MNANWRYPLPPLSATNIWLTMGRLWVEVRLVWGGQTPAEVPSQGVTLDLGLGLGRVDSHAIQVTGGKRRNRRQRDCLGRGVGIADRLADVV